MTTASSVAQWWPWTVSVSDELQQAVSFLGWQTDAETIVKCGYIASVVALLATAPLFWLFAESSDHRSFALLAGMGVSVLVADLTHRIPRVLATARRSAALGETPTLVSRAVLRMRLDPTPESAAAFAVRTSTGPLRESLAGHVRNARGTERTGFEGFTAEWASWYPSLRRALSLVGAAADAPAGERARTLDRALDAVLEGTRDSAETFVEQVQGPINALYAFGVLLPLALVAVLPAATAAGMTVTTTAFVVLYDVVLPVTLVAASVWLLVRRPLVFPATPIDATHPQVPAWRAVAPVGGCLAGALAALVTLFKGPSWGAPLAATGLGVGVTLVGWFHPVVQVQARVRAVEEGLTDGLYLVGQRVQSGVAVDAAIARTGNELGGGIGAMFEDAARTQRLLKTNLEAAFTGPYGALATLPSPRLKSAATLLSLAATEGQPAGRAIVSMADHLDDLQRVEADAQRSLRRVTGTVHHTGLIFAPLVGGTTVALAARLSGTSGGLTAQGLSFDILGSVIGAYVLLLAVLLTTLSVGLEEGVRRAQVGYHVGIAVIVAPTVFLLTVTVTQTLT